MSVVGSVSIDMASLVAMAERLSLEPAEIQKAADRALQRTSVTLRTTAQREFRTTLSLKSTKRARARVRMKRFGKGSDAEIELWIGQNPIPAGDFKTLPAGAEAGQFTHNGRPFRRSGSARLPVREAMVPVQAATDPLVSGEVQTQALDMFLANFEREVRARGIFGVGK